MDELSLSRLIEDFLDQQITDSFKQLDPDNLHYETMTTVHTCLHDVVMLLEIERMIFASYNTLVCKFLARRRREYTEHLIEVREQENNEVFQRLESARLDH